jgi:putative transposase
LVREGIAGGARLANACQVLGFSERTYQRWQRVGESSIDARTQRHHVPAHKLTTAERTLVLTVANSAEFGHLPPSQIVPRLADQQRYIASESTFYRILRAENQLAHRRREQVGKKRSKPRALRATGVNQVYSWDITYLPTLIRGLYFYLYMFVDIFSRKIVAAQVYAQENSANASAMVNDLCRREGIAPDQLVLHSDNGSPMKGSTLIATLQGLGVMTSLSRPAVSNDNPFSESLFKTLKYRPDLPLEPFADLSGARRWMNALVQWYNHEHRHSAIHFVTAAQRHGGLDKALLERRHAVYEIARSRHPLRWTRATRDWQHIGSVTLNPDKPVTDEGAQIETKAA